MTSRQIVVATRDGGTTALSSSRLDELDARFAGPVLRPGDRGWDDVLADDVSASMPALVLQAMSARDVAAVLAFADEHGLALTVVGGMPAVGASLVRGCLALDLSRLAA